jgi:hypothetical protein
MVSSQRGGSSTTLRPISREKANSSRLLVCSSISAAMPLNPLVEPWASLRRRFLIRASALRSTQKLTKVTAATMATSIHRVLSSRTSQFIASNLQGGKCA